MPLPMSQTKQQVSFKSNTNLNSEKIVKNTRYCLTENDEDINQEDLNHKF